MRYEFCCSDITIQHWNNLMRGARPCNYKNLVKKIKYEIPQLYDALALDFPNPYWHQCKQTKTHYVLVHSAIEHFISK